MPRNNVPTGAVVLALLMVPLMTMLRAFVLTRVWGWFVVPLGVPMIGMAWAYGLALAAFMFTGKGHVTAQDMERESPSWESSLSATIADALVLLLYWGLASIAHRWMT